MHIFHDSSTFESIENNFEYILPYLSLLLALIALIYTGRNFHLLKKQYRYSVRPFLQFDIVTKNLDKGTALTEKFQIEIILTNAGNGLAIITNFKFFVNEEEILIYQVSNWSEILTNIGLSGEHNVSSSYHGKGLYLKSGQQSCLLKVESLGGKDSKQLHLDEVREISNNFDFIIKYKSYHKKKYTAQLKQELE